MIPTSTSEISNDSSIQCRKMNWGDLEALQAYLSGLSEETKSRFCPHAFDSLTLQNILDQSDLYLGYIAVQKATGEILAYSIIQRGYVEHDHPRLESYGLRLDSFSDATFAPSVADEWQSQGIGSQLLEFIVKDLELVGIIRIILWGGVQSDNSKAVNFYRKHGFTTVGQFEYFGQNWDMVRVLS